MKFKPSFRSIALAALLVTAGTASLVHADTIQPPAGAEGIAPPAGHHPFLVLHARGVQTYTCTAEGTWSTASVPQADLYLDNGLVLGTHFGGPTWQLRDGSRTNGAKLKGMTVDPTAVAWLLLQAVNPMPGAEGDRLAKTTYIQRVNTVGGLAPAGGCTVGTTISIPYEADYYFYCADGTN